jgi:hypothetical protein
MQSCREVLIIDFSEQEKIFLKFQLKHFEVSILNNSKLQRLFSIAELCRGLIEVGKLDIYYLIDRLIRFCFDSSAVYSNY